MMKYEEPNMEINLIEGYVVVRISGGEGTVGGNEGEPSPFNF